MASMIDEILAQIPAEDLAAQLGTDPDTAMDAARKALPALLGGLSNNVSAGGGDALGAAVLGDHADDLLGRPDLLSSIDTADGQKILGHIFGDQQDRVVERLGATSRAGSSIFTKLLPLLAPLVMSWLAKKVGGMFGGGAAQTSGAPLETTDGRSGGLGGLGGLLGGLFGGGADDSALSEVQGPPTTESASGLGGLGSLAAPVASGACWVASWAARYSRPSRQCPTSPTCSTSLEKLSRLARTWPRGRTVLPRGCCLWAA